MSAAKSGTAMSTNCIQLIDKNDAGGILLSLLKKIANSGSADTYKHLDKIRT